VRLIAEGLRYQSSLLQRIVDRSGGLQVEGLVAAERETRSERGADPLGSDPDRGDGTFTRFPDLQGGLYRELIVWIHDPGDILLVDLTSIGADPDSCRGVGHLRDIHKQVHDCSLQTGVFVLPFGLRMGTVVRAAGTYKPIFCPLFTRLAP